MRGAASIRSKLLEVRVAIVSTILDTLSSTAETKCFGMPTLSRDRIGLFGHSFGGASTADAMLVEPRTVTCLSLDGRLYSNAANHTDKASFVLIDEIDHNQSPDPLMRQGWSQHGGPKLQLEVANTGMLLCATCPS